MKILEQAQKARIASKSIRHLSHDTRNHVLLTFADGLLRNQNEILQANLEDVLNGQASGMSPSLLDRLTLNEDRIVAMVTSIQQIARIDDPLNQILEEKDLPSGIHLKKITVPIGVIGIIFESRPNVTSDCCALCFKTGNACILKGGKESYQTCLAIVKQMKSALAQFGINEDAVMLIENTTHEELQAFMEDRDSVDLLIPRGGKKLIQAVVQHAKVPVIETGAGVCHAYIDASADLDMATNIVVNTKCSHPSVCNAVETVLVHEQIASQFLPKMAEALEPYHVLLHGDIHTHQILPTTQLSDDSCYYEEYNDYEMNVKIVKNIQEAIDHIEKYGTHHSECIVSNTKKNVELFMDGCDSACVYHNASTRFTDGYEFGYGAEIGISTQKLHARGPMGLQALTTYTFHLEGEGEIRK